MPRTNTGLRDHKRPAAMTSLSRDEGGVLSIGCLFRDEGGVLSIGCLFRDEGGRRSISGKAYVSRCGGCGFMDPDVRLAGRFIELWGS